MGRRIRAEIILSNQYVLLDEGESEKNVYSLLEIQAFLEENEVDKNIYVNFIEDYNLEFDQEKCFRLFLPSTKDYKIFSYNGNDIVIKNLKFYCDKYKKCPNETFEIMDSIGELDEELNNHSDEHAIFYIKEFVDDYADGFIGEINTLEKRFFVETSEFFVLYYTSEYQIKLKAQPFSFINNPLFLSHYPYHEIISQIEKLMINIIRNYIAGCFNEYNYEIQCITIDFMLVGICKKKNWRINPKWWDDLKKVKKEIDEEREKTLKNDKYHQNSEKIPLKIRDKLIHVCDTKRNNNCSGPFDKFYLDDIYNIVKWIIEDVHNKTTQIDDNESVSLFNDLFYKDFNSFNKDLIGLRNFLYHSEEFTSTLYSCKDPKYKQDYLRKILPDIMIFLGSLLGINNVFECVLKEYLNSFKDLSFSIFNLVTY